MGHDRLGERSQGPGEDGSERFWDLSSRILGACIEVHRHCGPGLLESVYEECLGHELRLRGIPFVRQRPIPLVYKELAIDAAYRMDFLVDESVIVEVKAVEAIAPVHLAQLLTYLNLATIDVGLVVNFNTAYLRDGVRRLRRKVRSPRAAHAMSRVPWPEHE